MVGAKLAGATTAAIARAEGLSRDWTGQELGSDECRQIVLDLVAAHRLRIARLFDKTLESIDQAFKADKVIGTPTGRRNLGADHFARLAAGKRLLEVISLGRPTAQARDQGKHPKRITIEELRAIVAEREKSTKEVVN